MLRFFRFRFISLLMKDSMRKYFLYAVGEIVLITIGILIALQINNWTQERTDRKLEKVFLNRLLEDLNDDVETFTAEVEAGNQGLEAIRQAVLLMDQIDSEEDVIAFNRLYDQTFMVSLSPHYATYQELESTGRLNIIQSDSLRSAIQDHYVTYERMEDEFAHHAWYRKSVARVMDAESLIMKYAGGVDHLFPPERRLQRDWAFFKDPDHPEYRNAEIALSAGGWLIGYDLFLYAGLLERIESLQADIKKELESL